MADWDDDVLEPYYAFVFMVGAVVIGFGLMILSARFDHKIPVKKFFMSWFRQGSSEEINYAVGCSSLDILASTVANSLLNFLVLGVTQLAFVPALATMMFVVSSLGLQLLLRHKWSFMPCCKSVKPIHPGTDPFTTATNRFQDLTQPFSRVLLAGLSQITMLILYVWSVFDSGRPPYDSLRGYMFYIVGTFLTVSYVTMNDLQNGRRKDADFWRWFFYYVRTPGALDKGEFLVEGDEDAKLEKVRPVEADIRYFLDTVINSMGLGVLQCAIPIQVAGDTSPGDFVLNVLAAYFIIELDDADDVTLVYREFACDSQVDIGDVENVMSRRPPSKQLSERIDI